MLKRSLLALLSITCFSWCFAAPAEVKRCVFSIEVIRDGGGLRAADYTAVGDGIFLFEDADGRITGERHQRWDQADGLVFRCNPEKEVFGGGAEFTARVRALFKKSAIQEMDFPAAAQAAQEQAMRQGRNFVQTGEKTVAVFADLEGTRFRFSAAGLGWHLRSYAEYHAKLTALKALLDGIAYEYGRSRISID